MSTPKKKEEKKKDTYKAPKLKLKAFKAPSDVKGKKVEVSKDVLPKIKKTKAKGKIKKITPRMKAEKETDEKVRLMMEKMRLKSEKKFGNLIKGLK